MNSKSSVTDWLRALEKGDDDAARRLWERYSGQMHDVARRRMRRLTRKDIVEEEDMVVSAFASLCLAARKGQCSGVKDRNGLWGLMIVATLRKVGQRSEYTQAAKRGAGLLIDQGQRCAELGSGMQRVACDSPSPVSAALQAERVEELLSKLNDDDQLAVALLQLAGKPVGVSLPHPGDEWGIFSAHFSPDGQRLLTTNKDGFARLWDWRTGSLTCPPLEHADELFDAAFLGDGRFCVTSERGDRIHFWDLTSGKRM